MEKDIPYGSWTKVIEDSPSEVRQQLREQIAMSDIEFDEGSWSGTAGGSLFGLAYEWSITETAEGTEVTERWWIPRSIFYLLFSMLISILLSSVVFFSYTVLEEGLIELYTFGQIWLITFIPSILTQAFVSDLPMPIEEIDDSVESGSLATITVSLIGALFGTIILTLPILLGFSLGYINIQSKISMIVFLLLTLMMVGMSTSWIWGLKTDDLSLITWEMPITW